MEISRNLDLDLNLVAVDGVGEEKKMRREEGRTKKPLRLASWQVDLAQGAG